MQNRDRVSAGRDPIKLAHGRAIVNWRPHFAILLLPVARKSFGVIEEAAANTPRAVAETSDHYANLTSSSGASAHHWRRRDHRRQCHRCGKQCVPAHLRILAKFCLQSIVSLRKCAAQPWSGLLFIIASRILICHFSLLCRFECKTTIRACDSLAEASKRHQREVMRVHLVAQIEVVRKTGARKLAVLPPSVVVLPFFEPGHPAPRAFAELVLSGKHPDQCPRGLRRRACAFAFECRILVAEARLTPAAIGMLHRLEPFDRAFNPGLVRIDANRAQPGERREGAVDIADTPAAPPRTVALLVALEPRYRPARHRMV